MKLESRRNFVLTLEEDEARDLYNYLAVAYESAGVPRPPIVTDLQNELMNRDTL